MQSFKQSRLENEQWSEMKWSIAAKRWKVNVGFS